MTTYRRPALLRSAVASVLNQTDGDFELLIGNDDVEGPLTLADAGTDDRRVRILNHPARLGEPGNMNALLFAAKGELFTWQADDDECAPNFVERMGAALRVNRASAALCGYETIDESGRATTIVGPGSLLNCSGAEFLSRYWRNEVRTMAPTGVYRTAVLRSWGGIREFSSHPISIMGEYFLLVQVGTLPDVVYLPDPLARFRHHASSWSESQADHRIVAAAGRAFVRSAARIIEGPAFARDYVTHAAGVACLAQSYARIALSRSGRPRDLGRRLHLLATVFAAFGGAWQRHPAALCRALGREIARLGRSGWRSIAVRPDRV